MHTMTNHERSNTHDRAAYMRGRDDARAGLERFPQCQHPDQYGAYNAGYRDWHKLQLFGQAVAALEFALPVLRSAIGQAVSASEIADIERIIREARA